jgi:CubicO group peptidase (beta-lactamase class C family)
VRTSTATVLAGLALVIVQPSAQSPALARGSPESVGLSAARLTEATALLRQYVTDQKIAGAVAAVARNGKLAYLEAVGVQDLESKTPMTDTSLFRIYSMTKPVTAVAVMMLHEEGKFALTDPVTKYLPDFKRAVVAADGTTRPPAREMTIEDLLLHTSGLNHRTSDIYRKAEVRTRTMTMATFIDNLIRVPLMEDPGTRYRYSEATTVLGRLVEIWSGQPFDTFLATRIFKPLRMSDTFFVVDQKHRAKLTTVYAVDSAGGGLKPIEIEALPFTERPTLLEGAVGLVSTVPDYLRFSQMLLNKGELDGARILKPATVEQMTSNGLRDAIQKARPGPMGWGLANVNVVIDPASPLAGEYGWDGSAGTIFWIHPVRQMITVLMWQSVPANPDQLRQRFKALVQQAIVN